MDERIIYALKCLRAGTQEVIHTDDGFICPIDNETTAVYRDKKITTVPSSKLIDALSLKLAESSRELFARNSPDASRAGITLRFFGDRAQWIPADADAIHSAFWRIGQIIDALRCARTQGSVASYTIAGPELATLGITLIDDEAYICSGAGAERVPRPTLIFELLRARAVILLLQKSGQ